MDFMKLFGTVIAVLIHPGSTSKQNGQRICRRGTERPCYKVSYVQDSRWRLSFANARLACRADGGELLSIETESEQRLVERFIQQLQAGDGDFWIGLRRKSGAGGSSPGCPSQYYWLDGSKAKFRHWQWDEPSCGAEMCVVLYHRPSALPDEEGHLPFQWNDDNCSSKNNYVCKYPEEQIPAITDSGSMLHTGPTLRPNIQSTTEGDVNLNRRLPESSVSLSDNSTYVSYTLCATIPVLLLLLFVATGFLCYKHIAKRKKTETASYPSGPEPRASAATCITQGPYAFSDISKLHYTALTCSVPADRKNTSAFAPPLFTDTQFDYYEDVPCPESESSFVTNDIYESCRGRSHSHCPGQTGWVENEIYG